MNFVIQMKNPESGLELKTRKGIDKNGDEVLYHSCFVGAEAVDWMMNMLNIKKKDRRNETSTKIIRSRGI